jgi:hypothetical protein
MNPRNRKTLIGTAVASTLAFATLAQAQVPPDHCINICQSASFYANYSSTTGPTGFKRTLYYGDKVGHTRGSHPVYNGWAATFDYGPNDWGYMRYECLGGWYSW